VWIEHTVL